MKKILLIFTICTIFLSCQNTFFSKEDTEAHTVSVKEEKSPVENAETDDSEEDNQTEDDSCEQDETDEVDSPPEPVPEPEPAPIPKVREWTVVVYMAADNNLEPSAIDDINELEAADFDSDIVTVLVLVDRASGYDASNGDWTDTRLLKIAHDENGKNTTIVSPRIDCEELGLIAASQTELDMANKSVLSGVLTFSRRAYPAEKTALIMWGHGTGWRSSENSVCPASDKAFAVDDTTGTYLSLPKFASGIAAGMGGKKLDFCGFDTCFGICFESMYEIKSCAALAAGTSGVVPADGWDYEQLLNTFFASDKSANNFAECASEQYKKQYSGYKYACFSIVSLSEMENLFSLFDDFSISVASKITGSSIQESALSILKNQTAGYSVASYPSDYYLDVYDMTLKMSDLFPSVFNKGAAVRDALSQAIIYSWNADGSATSRRSLGVFFNKYYAAGIAYASYDPLYIHGSRESDQTKFVINSTGYVPSQTDSGSLLDVLFKSFN